MKSQIVTPWVVLMIAVAAVLGYVLYEQRGGKEPAPEPTTQAESGEQEAEAPAAGDSPADDQDGQMTSEDEAGGEEQSVEAEAPEGEEAMAGEDEAQTQTQTAAKPPADASVPPPQFDVVRVEPDGSAVIAGRGEPGAEVTVLLNDKPFGSETADRRGEWVLIAPEPIPPGEHRLTLSMTTEEGETVESTETVVVVVPEPAPRIAGDDTGGETGGARATGEVETAEAQTGETQTGETETAETQTGGITTDGDETDAAVGSEAADETTRGPVAVLIPRDPDRLPELLQGGSGEGLTAGDLALDVIDYDSEGRIAVGGRADPGARLRLYLDNRLIGEAEADDEGRWRIRPEEPVEEGLHTLRVDQVGEDGAVIARVETPFSRSDLALKGEGERFVVVQPGNSLWRIARTTYGQGIRYSVIFEANQDQIRDPDLIYPGQIFVVPEE